MTSTEARQSLTAAVTERTRLAGIAAQTEGSRARAAAYRALEDAEFAVTFAAADVERAVRAENLAADEATVQTMSRVA